MKVFHLLLLALFVGALSSSCAKSDDCPLDELDAQPTKRFVAGHTYWLPKSACGANWSVKKAPEGSTAEIALAADGIGRFTPTVTGQYVFSLEGQNVERSLQVIEASSAPFHNLNYYGSSTMVRVGEQIWVAGVSAAVISRHEASTGQPQAGIPVGSWPVALAYAKDLGIVAVAQRGSDTLGIVDVEQGRLIDAIWVGDEPANIVLSDDRAYVALAGQGAVAVVNLKTRSLEEQIPVVIDPLGLSIDEAGQRLFVASHRSGHPDRTPYPAYAVENEKDIAIVDLTTRQVTGHILDVGTTITGLAFEASSGKLLITHLVNDTVASLSETDEPNFIYELARIEAKAGVAERLLAADLTRQSSSNGHAVALHSPAIDGDLIWVVAEGSDVTLALDRDTFDEVARIETPGRPRHVISSQGVQYVHGQQGFVLHRIENKQRTHDVTTTTDPRPELLAEGQAYFTGAGRDYAANWSCNSCHNDGLTDSLIWNAGPFSDRIVARPFFWLEGTWPLGWAGYMSNVRNYAFEVNTNVGVRPTSEEFNALWAYLRSLMPPPAANGYTRRDGSLSEQGLRGKELYEGKGACADCHGLPLTTNRASMPEGVTEGVSDIPALVGAYRHNVWLKFGDATTLNEAVAMVDDWQGGKLNDDERALVTRYLRELTGRDFFVLTSEPRAGTETLATDGVIELVMSLPVVNDEQNRKRITLVGPSGPVETDVTIDNRYVRITPKISLDPKTEYSVDIHPDFESFDERKLTSTGPILLTTTAAPALTISGEYIWQIDMPQVNVELGQFDTSSTNPTSVAMTVNTTETGGTVVLDYGSDLELNITAVVDGTRLITGPLPIPAGPSFTDSEGIDANLIDNDSDGVADFAKGTVTLTGPGFVVPEVSWVLTRKPKGCELKENGVSVVRNDGAISFDWGSDNAIGLYVTSQTATLPMGPGTFVGQGDAYWVVEFEDFDIGFAGPVTYGTVPTGGKDTSELHGGTVGGTSLNADDCVKVSVVTKKFQIKSTVFKW